MSPLITNSLEKIAKTAEKISLKALQEMFKRAHREVRKTRKKTARANGNVFYNQRQKRIQEVIRNILIDALLLGVFILCIALYLYEMAA